METYRIIVKKNIVPDELLELFYKQYGDKCPLCGQKECLQYIGTYIRQVIYIDKEITKYYDNYEIVRFLCNKKKCTVSLLPAGLIPYRKYSISFINIILMWYLLDKKSLPQINNIISNQYSPDYLFLTYHTIQVFMKYLLIAINTHSVVKNTNTFKEDTIKNQIIAFIQNMDVYENNKIRGPDGFAFDFYFQEGHYRKQAQFLFGIPWQYR